MSFEVAQQNNGFQNSPLTDIHRDICGQHGEYCKSEGQTYTYPQAMVHYSNTNQVEQSAWDKLKEHLNNAGRTVADSALGIGESISTYKNMFLFRNIELPVNTVRAGIFRAVGGVASAAAAGFRTIQAAQEDFRNKEYSFPRARRESVVSVSSIAAGGVVGATAGGLAALVGAKGAALVGIGVLGAGAIGYAVTATRDYVGNLYDRYVTGKDVQN